MNTLYKLKHKATGLFVSAPKAGIYGLNKKGYTFMENPVKKFNSISMPRDEISIEEFELVVFTKESVKQKLVQKKIDAYVEKYKDTAIFDDVLKAVTFGYNLK